VSAVQFCPSALENKGFTAFQLVSPFLFLRVCPHFVPTFFLISNKNRHKTKKGLAIIGKPFFLLIRPQKIIEFSYYNQMNMILAGRLSRVFLARPPERLSDTFFWFPKVNTRPCPWMPALFLRFTARLSILEACNSQI
jgi:hypothetical protein